MTEGSKRVTGQTVQMRRSVLFRMLLGWEGRSTDQLTSSAGEEKLQFWVYRLKIKSL